MMWLISERDKLCGVDKWVSLFWQFFSISHMRWILIPTLNNFFLSHLSEGAVAHPM